MLVSKFHGWNLQSARHRTEERGGEAELISIVSYMDLLKTKLILTG